MLEEQWREGLLGVVKIKVYMVYMNDIVKDDKRKSN